MEKNIVSKEAMDMMLKVVDNNKGALSITANLFKEFGIKGIEYLFDQKINGRDVWLLFNEISGRDINKMFGYLEDNAAIEKLRRNPHSSFNKLRK